ncbi:MAG TPA: DUF4199 domain-containing protein [Thermoanaerobaculia bacterium]|nr:DUF4199 domain-containing protein [Thermoanaerobaculia bacterium]
MRRIVLTYGLLAGAIVALMLVAMIATMRSSDELDIEGGQVYGYASMVLAFLLVFFGIRRYRDTVGGGAIGFRRALGVGLLITLVACAVYVVTWEILYYGFVPDFAERYGAAMVARMRESGESAAAIAATEADMARFAEMYRNPLVNVGMTFLEIFPVGLVMTLISAAILRRRVAGFTPGTAPG